MNDVMPGSAEDFVDVKKKQLLSFGLRRGRSIFGLAEARPVGGLRNVLHVVEFDGKVSIERNCVSLSSCRKTLNSKR